MDNDESFKKWFDRLKSSTEGMSEQQEAVDELNAAEVANLIQVLLKEESSKFPDWAEDIPSGRLVSTEEELRHILRHVALPHAIAAYKQVRALVKDECATWNGPKANADGENEEQDEEDVADSGSVKDTHLVPFHIAPLSTDRRDMKQAMTNFLSNLSSSHTGSLVRLCMLADINHRLSRASIHDSALLRLSREDEEERRVQSATAIEQAQRRLRVLQSDSTDEEAAALRTCESALEAELKERNTALEQAEKEEDEARRLYEAAIAKRKKAATKVDTIDSLLVATHTQRKTLQSVTSRRLELENYNIASASKRIDLLSQLDTHLAAVKEKLLGVKIKEDVLVMFEQLVSVFKSSFLEMEGRSFTRTQLADRDIQMFLAAQIGLETIRLWRQMSPVHVIDVMKDTLNAFEVTLRSIIKNLPVPSPDDSAHTTGIARHNDSTVILYFDHIFHDTPRAHVENQDRVKTSMDALKAILLMAATPVTASDTKHLASPLRSLVTMGADKEFSNKRQARRTRAVQMIRCNDVLSPPLWAVPLVHSPQYIAQLWELAQEAKQEDLLVPLEFDTEWESDMGKAESSDDDAPTGNKANARLKRTLVLPPPVALSVGPEISSQYSKLLAPVHGDETIAKALHQYDKERGKSRELGSPNVENSRHRRKDKAAREIASLTNDPSSRTKPQKDASRSSTKASKGDKLEVGCKVSTPYGRGVVRSLGPNNQGPVVVDFTGHKATGYLAKDVCEIIPDATVMPELPAETIASILVEERTRVLNEEFKDGQVQFKSMILPDDRFKFIHPFLHRVMSQFVKIVKVQKRVSDAAKLSSATVSLWIHGRASRGVSRSIQGTLVEYIKYFDEYDVLKFLDDYTRFDDDSTEESGNDDSSDGSEDESEVEGEEEEQQQEKSNEIPTHSKRVSFSRSTGDDDRDDDNSVASVSDAPDNRRGKLSTVASVTLVPSSTGSVMPSTEEDDLVRLLLKKTMKLTNTSQTAVANYFKDNYGEHSSQGKLSGWVLYKLREPTHSSHRSCTLKWVRANAARLPPEDVETLERLEVWEKTLDAAAPTRRRRTPEKVQPVSHRSISSSGANTHSINTAGATHRLLSFAQSIAESKAMLEQMDEEDPIEGHSKEEASEANDKMSVDSADKQDETETHVEPDTNNVLSSSATGESNENIKDSSSIKEEPTGSCDNTGNMTPPSQSLNNASAVPYAEFEEFTAENITKEVVSSLRDDIRREIARRRIVNGIVCNEAQLYSWGQGNEAIQAFLFSASLEVTEQALEFYNLLLKWLRSSVKKYVAPSMSEALKHKFTAARPKPTQVSDDSQRVVASDGSEVLTPRPVIADSFSGGFHYPSCEDCREGSATDTLLCSLCPCRYHPKCLESQELPSEDTDKTNWLCPQCVENRVSEAEEVTAEEKADIKSWNDRWLLIFSSALRRWRPGVVTNTTMLEKPMPNGAPSLTQYLVLIKWWRTDNRGGKSSWMNITRARVLRVSPPPGSENLGAPRRSSAKARRPDEEGDGDEKVIKRRKFQSVSTFLDTDEGTSAIPRSQFLSTDGVGGRSALYGDDNNDRPISPRGASKKEKKGQSIVEEGSADTYISSESVQSALCAAGVACKAVDVVMCSKNTNVFACTRPPGHHAGRYGCTRGCLSTGFCLLNNAAFASVYARVRWGLERVAVVDIDVHFGNGTAELLRGDPRSFFASVHMIYGPENAGLSHTEGSVDSDLDMHTDLPKASANGFYPAELGRTEIEDNYVSVGVFPPYAAEKKDGRRRPAQFPKMPQDDEPMKKAGDGEDEENDGEAGEMAVDSDAKASSKGRNRSQKKPISGPSQSSAAIEPLFGVEGYRRALTEHILPRMEAFKPQLLVISAGFDGFHTDPLGGDLGLSLDDYVWSTQQLMASMERISGPGESRVISLLEGGYDVSPDTLGLARCVVAHVKAMREDTN